MKAEIVSKEKEFEPIVITLTIESKEELNTFYGMVNSNNSSISKNRYSKNTIVNYNFVMPLFDVLQHKCDKTSF